MTDEAFDLDRFIKAQAPCFASALRELGEGRKRGHWMWFIFPQLRGLGSSAMSMHYGIVSLAEAEAYLRHAVLGPRLTECTHAVLDVGGRSLTDIFGSPDDLKFHSSMTLFARAGGAAPFRNALERYCEGRTDARTLAVLEI